MAVLGERWVTACVAVTMAGALLGFLRYNFPPASIYLGDAGSMLVGLVIGSLGDQKFAQGSRNSYACCPRICDSDYSDSRHIGGHLSTKAHGTQHLYHRPWPPPSLLAASRVFQAGGIAGGLRVSASWPFCGAFLSIAFQSEYLAAYWQHSPWWRFLSACVGSVTASSLLSSRTGLKALSRFFLA